DVVADADQGSEAGRVEEGDLGQVDPQGAGVVADRVMADVAELVGVRQVDVASDMDERDTVDGGDAQLGIGQIAGHGNSHDGLQGPDTPVARVVRGAPEELVFTEVGANSMRTQ